MGSLREILVVCIALAGLAGIAIGRTPFLRMNRVTVSVVAATILVAIGALGVPEAFAAVDLDTIFLLLGMMVLTAWLEFSGLLSLASAVILRSARGPRSLLAVIVAASGLLSAFFINDTMCIVLSPLVTLLCLNARRDPVPYLVGVATASNIGSMCSIIGNPQNMIIGARSGIAFGSFMLRLAPPALASLGIAWLVIQLCWKREFSSRGAPLPPPRSPRVHRPLALKALVASLGLAVLLFLGIRPSLAAMIAASFLLLSRAVKPAKVLAKIDFGLLLFFACLFIITRAIRDTALFSAFASGLGSAWTSGPWRLSASTALLSNVVSNVPAVMLLSPLVEGGAMGQKGWLVLAMASTFAGNLTLLGSVANLIVAERASRRGVKLGFLPYLKAGLPITILSVACGAAWLAVLG